MTEHFKRIGRGLYVIMQGIAFTIGILTGAIMLGQLLYWKPIIFWPIFIGVGVIWLAWKIGKVGDQKKIS